MRSLIDKNSNPAILLSGTPFWGEEASTNLE